MNIFIHNFLTQSKNMY